MAAPVLVPKLSVDWLVGPAESAERSSPAAFGLDGYKELSSSDLREALVSMY